MTRKIAAFAVTAAAVDSPPAAPRSPADTDPTAAKATIEHAAQEKLAAESVPAEAREQGLRASYSNAATVAQDKQVVGLFVVKNADLAGKVSEQVRQSAPKSAKLIVDGNVLVVYAPAGDDRSAAVEQAVKAL